MTCTVPLCPSSVWFMLKLLGAASPRTLLFLTEGGSHYIQYDTKHPQKWLASLTTRNIAKIAYAKNRIAGPILRTVI